MSDSWIIGSFQWMQDRLLDYWIVSVNEGLIYGLEDDCREGWINGWVIHGLVDDLR